MAITTTTFSAYGGIAAPAVSAAGTGRIYFDTATNKFRISQNGGAYDDLSPAGAVGTVQYRAATGLAGAAFLTINALGYPILGESTTAPVAPAAGATVYARFRAGRRMAAPIGPSGVAYSFQPGIFGHHVGWITALGNSVTVSAVGLGSTATGVITARTVATTSYFTAVRRVGYATAGAAGSSAGIRNNAAQWWFGSAAGLGGFFFVARFGVATAPAGYRMYVGLSATTTVFANANPSALLNSFGIGLDTNDANLQFMTNDGVGVATKTDLGATFPRPTANTEYFEVRLFAAPNSATLFWSIENLVNGAFAEGSAAADLPSNTTLLSWQVWINNAAALTLAAIDVSNIYMESEGS